MEEREEREGTPERTDEGPEEAAVREEEPQAGVREIAAAVFILVVVVAGLAYAWFQGYDTGFLNGQDKAWEEAAQDTRRKLPDGVKPAWHVLLDEGQVLTMTLDGPEDRKQNLTLEVGAGDRVVIAVGRSREGTVPPGAGRD